MPGPAVLQFGLDPNANVPTRSFDQGALKAALEASEKAVRDAGYDLKVVNVPPPVAVEKLKEALAEREWETVLIGGGIRLNPAMTELFEELVNVVHRTLPGKPIAFNQGPDTCLDAFKRAVPI